LKVECCYFSGVLCDDFFALCRPSIQATPAACLLTPLPLLPAYRRSIQLLSVLHCAPGACCKLLMQTIKVTNLGGPDTEQTSIDGNRVRHGLTSWLITLLIDCFPACGMRAVTFTSPHSADLKCKLLKLLHKYINKVQI